MNKSKNSKSLFHNNVLRISQQLMIGLKTHLKSKHSVVISKSEKLSTSKDKSYYVTNMICMKKAKEMMNLFEKECSMEIMIPLEHLNSFGLLLETDVIRMVKNHDES